jgi:methylmalonyl-CoA/ethylmalonyl-CoA epimerase
LLNKSHYKVEEVTSEKVATSFFQTGESKIELLAATSPDSTIAKYIEKKGEGIHHIAFAVNDIEAEVKRLIAEGFQPISAEPKKGADNKLVFFFHPKSTNGVLIELCQEII